MTDPSLDSLVLINGADSVRGWTWVLDGLLAFLMGTISALRCLAFLDETR